MFKMHIKINIISQYILIGIALLNNNICQRKRRQLSQIIKTPTRPDHIISCPNNLLKSVSIYPHQQEKNESGFVLVALI